jgi:hypothetical protein
MGNCALKQKSSTRKTNKKYAKPDLIAKPVVQSKYKLNQTQLIYEAVLNCYIRKKTIMECGAVYMSRGGRSHISIPLLPADLVELNETYMNAITKILEDYFLSIGVNHEIYIYPTVDDPNNFKLYCHLATFS